LAYSHKASDESFWEAVYREAFPDFVGFLPNLDRNEAQFRGVDRVILRGNDQVLRVDEKKRGRDYGDVLLEYLSVDTAGKAGWIEKDLAIDYLAYAFMPSRKVYLFPWLLLRRAWREHGGEWKRLGDQEREGFKTCKAQNDGYQTHSVAVPLDKLFRAISRASVIEVGLN
jgi:hypothetical protein